MFTIIGPCCGQHTNQTERGLAGADAVGLLVALHLLYILYCSLRLVCCWMMIFYYYYCTIIFFVVVVIVGLGCCLNLYLCAYI